MIFQAFLITTPNMNEMVNLFRILENGKTEKPKPGSTRFKTFYLQMLTNLIFSKKSVHYQCCYSSDSNDEQILHHGWN